jgi:hypothetical protein
MKELLWCLKRPPFAVLPTSFSTYIKIYARVSSVPEFKRIHCLLFCCDFNHIPLPACDLENTGNYVVTSPVVMQPVCDCSPACPLILVSVGKPGTVLVQSAFGVWQWNMAFLCTSEWPLGAVVSRGGNLNAKLCICFQATVLLVWLLLHRLD